MPLFTCLVLYHANFTLDNSILCTYKSTTKCKEFFFSVKYSGKKLNQSVVK